MPMVVLLAILVSLATFPLQVAALTLQWPTYPEANVRFSMQWSGGTAPYTAYVLTPDRKQYYYKYQGPELITYWNFTVAVGTEVVFQVIDETNLTVTSTPVTVIADLTLKYPGSPQQGGVSTLTWEGGLAPYTVYVLSPDLSYQYWSYSGGQTSAQWTCNVTPETQIVFQAIDGNGVRAKSNVVTVQGNSSQVTQSSLSVQSMASVASIEQQSLAQASLSTLSVASTASLASLASLSSATMSTSPTTASLTVSTTQSGTATTTDSFTAPPQSIGSNQRKSSTGAIAGGVVGGVVGLGIIAFLALLIVRKYKIDSGDTDPQPPTLSAQSRPGDVSHEDPFATPPDEHAGRGTGYDSGPQMGHVGTQASGAGTTSAGNQTQDRETRPIGYPQQLGAHSASSRRQPLHRMTQQQSSISYSSSQPNPYGVGAYSSGSQSPPSAQTYSGSAEV